MKKIVLVFAMIVFATTFFVNGAYAQGAQYGNEQEIPWINYSIDIDEATTENYPDGFYLCRIERNTGAGSVDGFSYDFVTAGGKYGTRAVLGNRGIKLEIENAGGGNYRFKDCSRIPILITDSISVPEVQVMKAACSWIRMADSQSHHTAD